jgi:hypothetical protein
MDPLGGWTTARRWPRTPGRGSAPVKRHSRIAVAGEQPHPRPRMGRSRRQTHRTTPTSGIGGLRRAAAQHPSSPPDRGSRHLAPSRQPRHRAEHSPVPNPLPQMGSPSRPQTLGGPESFSGIETAHLGSRQNLLYSGASRAGAALARRPPLLPHPPPRLPAPTREQFFSGGYGRGGHSPAAPAGAGSISTPLGDHPTSDGTHTRHGPLCPGVSVPPSPNHYTEPS